MHFRTPCAYKSAHFLARTSRKFVGLAFELDLHANADAPSRVVSYAEASRIVREHADRLAATACAAVCCAAAIALGMVLAEPVCADRDQPPFPRSTRDGFACRAADLAAGFAAQDHWLYSRRRRRRPSTFTPGQAVEIMTGAPVPAGADCVVMVEHVQRDLETLRLSPDRSIAPGDNIVPRGAEARAGEVIRARGRRAFPPAQVAAAAACGVGQLRVFARPRVAIVATGDELVEVDQQPTDPPRFVTPIATRSQRRFSPRAQSRCGSPSRAMNAGILKPSSGARCRADLLLLSGGVSMGKYDLVEEVLLSLGAEFFFTGALIQPGKPVVFGKARRRFTSSDFPAILYPPWLRSTLFVEPLLGALCGDACREPRFAQARLAT